MDWTRIKHFSPATDTRLMCSCGCGGEMNQDFMERLDALRARLSFPFIVRSGYRCPDVNERVSTTGRNGPHTTGRAVDLYLLGSRVFELLQFAPAFGMTGIGFKLHGPHERRFVHLDNLESEGNRRRPICWSYPS